MTEEKLILVTCKTCGSIIWKQAKGKTTKTIENITNNGGKRHKQKIVIEGDNLKIITNCLNPKCQAQNILTFQLEEPTGIITSYKGIGIEIINGKDNKITGKENRKGYKIRLKL